MTETELAARVDYDVPPRYRMPVVNVQVHRRDTWRACLLCGTPFLAVSGAACPGCRCEVP